MEIIINKDSRTPVYWQIANAIKAKIMAGEIPEGYILPSERALAKKLGVHRNTVVKAYSVLKDFDYVVSKQGIGYRVTLENDQAVCEKRKKKTVNWSALVKDEYQDIEKIFDKIMVNTGNDGETVSLSKGLPPAVYDMEKVSKQIYKLFIESEPDAGFMTPYHGDMELKRKIVSYLRNRGINAGMGQIQVVAETNQALDFIITLMLSPGDSVIVEEPISPDVYRPLQLAGCRVHTVPVDDDGIKCDNLSVLIEKHCPKFIYVSSSFQDPTGYTMSTERRRKLLDISEKYGVPIIEEDSASELTLDGPPVCTIKSMDDNGNVIYIHSFSLTFIPGLSLAFIVAPEKLIQCFASLVSIRVVSLDWLPQKLMAKYLESDEYHRCIAKINDENRRKREVMKRGLHSLKDIGVMQSSPRGGVYIWVQLPEYMDAKTVMHEASREGVSILPGELFYPHRNGGKNFIRLNYSYESEERISIAMEKLSDVIRKLAHSKP